MGWVRFYDGAGNSAWLQETASRIQQAQPGDALRITSCSTQGKEPRHPHARKP